VRQKAFKLNRSRSEQYDIPQHPATEDEDMSTQYTDHDTLERLPTHRRPASHAQSAAPHAAAFDHRTLAREWLLREECLQALRVADPTRGRFSPLRESTDHDAPQRWQPSTTPRPGIEQAFLDYRLLLNVHADWIVWRRPYSIHE
jgi:hypothetical protein